MTNYYDTSELICWLASRTFMDEHYGRALTEYEFEMYMAAAEDFKLEISQVKELLSGFSDFEKLSMKAKINTAANLLMILKDYHEAEKTANKNKRPL